jgi:urease accessory protein
MIARVGRFAAACGVALALTADLASAHPISVAGASVLDGLSHPFLGWDHALAMIAVGLWAAQAGGRARWTLPASFLVAMVVGAGLGMAGIALPRVESAIALSVLALGIAIASAARPVPWVGMALVGLFASFHGHAHGTEMPDALAPGLYGFGFVTATAALHGIGIAAAGLAGRVAPMLARVTGAVIAIAGALLLAA